MMQQTEDDCVETLRFSKIFRLNEKHILLVFLTHAAVFQLCVHLVAIGGISADLGRTVIAASSSCVLVIAFGRDRVGHFLGILTLLFALIFADEVARSPFGGSSAFITEIGQYAVVGYCVVGWRGQILQKSSSVADLFSITAAFAIALVIFNWSSRFGASTQGLGAVFVSFLILGLSVPKLVRLPKLFR